MIFIDKVANFIGTDEYIQSYFCECVKEYRTDERTEKDKPYAYYFANKKNKKEWTIEFVEDLWNSKEARTIEKEMYELIMREKEILLSFDNPVEFIFSHSALKEWRDNPNVFTLCTLRNSVSETEKRQSVGRGLRLPVNESWLRVYDTAINRLSVVVNQSYEDFCKQYQENLIQEWYSAYEAEKNSQHIENGVPETVSINPKRWESKLFHTFWNTINHKTYFTLDIQEEQLIASCIRRINNDIENYHITGNNTIQVIVAWVEIDNNSLLWIEEDSHTIQWEKQLVLVTSLIRIVQDELKSYNVSCGRKTLAEILKKMNSIHLFAKNPLQCAMLIAKAMHYAITEHYKESCMYHLSDESYDITTITQSIKLSKSHASYPKEFFCGDKSLFEKVMVDSSIEEAFGLWFQQDVSIEFFFKINDSSFKIQTPVGKFTPDRWVVIKKKQQDQHVTTEHEVYFMLENKWSDDMNQLKTIEQIKLACAKKHFLLLKWSMKQWFLEYAMYDDYKQFRSDVTSI